MTDTLSKVQRSLLMAKVRQRKTRPEKVVRQMLREFVPGMRCRFNWKRLPGSPDIVLPKLRTAIFVHGCFWHRHLCRSGSRTPKSNIRYWEAKFARNKARDRWNRASLIDLGWRVLVVWECQLNRDRIFQLRARLATALN